MKTNTIVITKKWIVYMVAGLVGAGTGIAGNAAPADPFVKGNQPPVLTAPKSVPAGAEAGDLEERLKGIIIPAVEFNQANLMDVVKFLQQVSSENDAKNRGVNMVVDTASRNNPPQITFSAKEISLLDALRLVTKLAGLKYRIENNVVMIGAEREPPHNPQERERR